MEDTIDLQLADCEYRKLVFGLCVAKALGTPQHFQIPSRSKIAGVCLDNFL